MTQLVLNEQQAVEVKRLVEYLVKGHEEGRHYLENPVDDHIFHSIKIVNAALAEPFDLSEFEGNSTA